MKHFHDIAYASSSKEELLDAIDLFLDGSIVLPPGDWDQDLILPLMHERHEMKRIKGICYVCNEFDCYSNTNREEDITF